MPASDATTLARCESDASGTIAALEKKLKDKRIELPPHGPLTAQPDSMRMLP
jgi:hypothetical protein